MTKVNEIIGASLKVDSELKLFAYSIGLIGIIGIIFFECPDKSIIMTIPFMAILLVLLLHSYKKNRQERFEGIESKIPAKRLQDESEPSNLLTDITEANFLSMYMHVCDSYMATNSIKPRYGLYISCPMDSYPIELRNLLKRELCELMVDIQNHNDGMLIECPAAILTNSDKNKYEDPKKSLMLCYARILFSSHFYLIYPQRLPSSSIFELGLALAFGKSITIFTKSKNELPYLVRDSDRIRDLPIEIFEYNGEFDNIKEILSNKKYKV